MAKKNNSTTEKTMEIMLNQLSVLSDTIAKQNQQIAEIKTRKERNDNYMFGGSGYDKRGNIYCSFSKKNMSKEERVHFILFKVDNKKTDKHPDYNLSIAKTELPKFLNLADNLINSDKVILDKETDLEQSKPTAETTTEKDTQAKKERELQTA